MLKFFIFRLHEARGIVAEPDTKARRAVVADGADSPTQARPKGARSDSPKHL
jgi:hypothetical protein